MLGLVSEKLPAAMINLGEYVTLSDIRACCNLRVACSVVGKGKNYSPNGFNGDLPW